MIGTRLEAPGEFPWAALIFTAAAACVALGAATSSVHWDIFAVLPAAIAAALWLTRRRGFVGDLTAEGLQDSSSGQLIRFAAMRAIEPPAGSTEAAGNSYPFVLLHDEGALRIPARLNVSSRGLAAFLASRIPLRPMSISPQLEEYWQRQLEAYGADRAWTFTAREMAKPRMFSRVMAVAAAGLGASVVWAASGGAMLHSSPRRRGDEWAVWLVAGGLSSIAWLIVLARANPQRRNPLRKIKNPEAACLVISPEGLALTQGKLSGELPWRELRKLRFQHGTSFFSVFGGPPVGLHLDVGGATIWIADIYDQPLEVIAARIRQYWHG
jgi:hypothetical protein